MNYFYPGEMVRVADGKGDIRNVLLPEYLRGSAFEVLRYDPVGDKDGYLCRSYDGRNFCFDQSVLRKA